MIKGLISDISLLFRFFLSPIIFGQLKGWTLIAFYTVSTLLSLITALVIIDDDYADTTRRSEYKLNDIKRVLANKADASTQYIDAGRRLNNAQYQLGLFDENDSCMITFYKFSYSDEFKHAGESELDKHKKQLQACSSKEAVTASTNDFAKNNAVVLRPFEDLESVFKLVSNLTSAKSGIGPVRYHTSPPIPGDFLDTIPFELNFIASAVETVSYMKLISDACSNCLVRLSKLTPQESSAKYNAIMSVNIYMNESDKKSLEKLQNNIATGRYAGDSLATFQASPK